jgi:hypothetical protein
MGLSDGPRATIDTLLAHVERFADGKLQADDLSVVVVRVGGGAPMSPSTGASRIRW